MDNESVAEFSHEWFCNEINKLCTLAPQYGVVMVGAVYAADMLSESHQFRLIGSKMDMLTARGMRSAISDATGVMVGLHGDMEQK